jgi:hypothetical protein
MTMDPIRERQAVFAGRRWAEEKAAALEGTSPHDWPDVWDRQWNEDMPIQPRLPKLTPEELTALIDTAIYAARGRWEELVEWERALDDRDATDDEAQAVALYEQLREHVPAGLSVGRDGARVYLQDVSDAADMTVRSLADASRAISDWLERHIAR